MTEKQICGNCVYWNNDTGFCSVETIPKSKNEVCDIWKGDSDD